MSATGRDVTMDPLAPFRNNPAAKWVGLALIAIALIALPFVLAMAGTAWVRITNLAILFVMLSLGLKEDTFSAVDGSGLSRQNFISPNAVTLLLSDFFSKSSNK